jgi:hypothetical protein
MTLQKLMLKKDKKGSLEALNLGKSVLLVVVSIILVAVIGLLILTTVRTSGLFPAGSPENITMTSWIGNYSALGNAFIGSFGTIGTILLVVVIVSMFALVLYVVNRFGSGNSTGI